MNEEKNTTPFSIIYDSFLNRVNSEYYLEMTEVDTIEQLQSLLINAIPRFRLPRFDIFDYELGNIDFLGSYCGVDSNYTDTKVMGWIGGYFNSTLTAEEINILSLGMLIEWFIQQLSTTELAKMKFSGSDYRFSSQANHMAKLKLLVDSAKSDMKTLQDTYKRRLKTNKNIIISSFGTIMDKPKYVR